MLNVRLLLVSVGLIPLPVLADVYRVDQNSSSPGNGGSWCTAFVDLQGALAVAGAGDEIRVADGVYTPDGGTGDVLVSFEVPSGVQLLGGYAGCGAADPDQRDPDAFETVLSGDLAGDDGPAFANYGENSFVVVRTSQASASTVLDGLTISGGNADGPLGQYDRGGGMNNFLGAPKIRNCVFRANSGTQGGAMMNDASDATIEQCRFEQNAGIGGGGAIFNYNNETVVRNCDFTQNSAVAGVGAAVYAYNSTVSIDRCGIFDNSTYAQGAVALYTNSTGMLSDCVFDGNVGGAFAVVSGASCQLKRCTFNDNHGSAGAALSISGFAVIEASIFTANVSASNGGAISMLSGDLLATDCTFAGNSSTGSAGGAALLLSTLNARFVRCAFEDNTAERGGAVYVSSSATVEFVRSVFRANTATQDHGGAVYAGTDFATRLVGCRLLGNTAAGDGGGVYVASFSNLYAASTFFAGNQASEEGGGAYVGFDSTAHFANCTLTRNQTPNGRGGIYNSAGQLVVDNSILWNNGGLSSFSQIDGTAPQVNYSCIPGSWGGVGNIASDPLLFDADGPDNIAGTEDDNPHLLFGSLCINQGNDGWIADDEADADHDGNVGEPLPIDVDGHARVLCGAVDMGASESGIGDSNCDGTVDLTDFATWTTCMTGPDAGPYPGGCAVFDFEYDGDVDARDHAAWQREVTAP